MVFVTAAIAVGILTWVLAALAAGIGLGRIIARADSEERHALYAPAPAELSGAATL